MLVKCSATPKLQIRVGEQKCSENQGTGPKWPDEHCVALSSTRPRGNLLEPSLAPNRHCDALVQWHVTGPCGGPDHGRDCGHHADLQMEPNLTRVDALVDAPGQWRQSFVGSKSCHRQSPDTPRRAPILDDHIQGNLPRYSCHRETPSLYT
jgi:hypothetical protein